MKTAKIIFRIAGIWGLLVLTPTYFLLDKLGRDAPPPVTHAEFYYGFVGLAMVWQVAFFIIASDPLRFRPVMVAAMLEKFVYVLTLLVLSRTWPISAGEWVGGGADFILGVLFIVAYRKTPAQA